MYRARTLEPRFGVGMLPQKPLLHPKGNSCWSSVWGHEKIVGCQSHRSPKDEASPDIT